MPTQLRLPKAQLTDLAIIRDLGLELLTRVADNLPSQPAYPLRPDKLEAIISTVIEDTSKVHALIRTLLSLYQLVRQRQLSVDNIFEGLDFAITLAEPAWSETELDQWRRSSIGLRRLLDAPAIRVVSKAIDLAYDYANLFQSARILTDVRPIFGDDRSAPLHVDGAVVSFTLRLHFDSRDKNHSVSIVLDESDVVLLREQCDYAIQKARYLQSQLAKGLQCNAVISGETADASRFT